MAKCFNCDTEIGAGSKRQLDALALRDTLGKSYTDIATELGGSRQRAARLVEGGRWLSPNRAATVESEPEPARERFPRTRGDRRAQISLPGPGGSPAHAGIDPAKKSYQSFKI